MANRSDKVYISYNIADRISFAKILNSEFSNHVNWSQIKENR